MIVEVQQKIISKIYELIQIIGEFENIKIYNLDNNRIGQD